MPIKVGLYSRTVKETDAYFINQLIASLRNAGIKVLLYNEYAAQIADLLPEIPLADTRCFTAADCQPNAFDFLLSIGGDGTLLNTVGLVKNSNIPVLGINTGRLGLLTDVGKSEIDHAWQALLQGKYCLERRSLISLDSQPALFENTNYALNEFAIVKQDTSAMIVVHTYIDNVFLNSYWADGIIVATPTGSTAYSMSCGGPIVHPDSRAFTITPIAPHNLNVRPIVVPDTANISFKVEGRSPNFLCTLDSRSVIIDDSYQLSVRKSDFDFCLVRVLIDEQRNFFSTIRQKLMWGQDTRN
jgi:NAD+ kinase